MHKKHRLLSIALTAIAVIAVTSVAIAVGSGWTTHTGEQLPHDPTTAKTGGCTGLDTIFCDGFESGDLTGWFAPQPCQVPIINLPVPTPKVAP